MCRFALAAFLTTLLACLGAHGQPHGASLPNGVSAVPDASEALLTKARIENETAQALYYQGQLAKQSSSSPPAWLQTVIGGMIAIAGSIGTLLLTTRFTERRTRDEQQQTYARHEHQIQLAVKELHESLKRLTPELPKWVDEDLVYDEPHRPSIPNRNDRYYLKYDLVDCIYRLCAFLGWLELYRTDSKFLRGPSPAKQQQIECFFAEIRRDLADEFIDEKKQLGRTDWCDGFILEEDQRAIGEQMLDREQSEVIGYAAFCERLFCSPKRDNPTGWEISKHQNWWVWNATRFIFELNLKGIGRSSGQQEPMVQQTFALTRISRMEGHCAELETLIRQPSPQPK